MNTNHTKSFITAMAAAICIGGAWATPAQATKADHGAGRPAAVDEIDVGQVVAMRKAQMARDHVARAAVRAAYADDRREHAAYDPWAAIQADYVRYVTASAHRAAADHCAATAE
ncbi:MULTISPECIES: hypothetical protein [unclassified Nocardioides]|uniref:hypothetical protein n=1 Tax=unclassified Nocardioides TaxID=2615069 RepID=UPI00361505E7